jgi:hypothetical protein
MSQEVTFPRHASFEAQMKLERAEAVVKAFCEFCADLAALYPHRIPAAQDDDALVIRRAWLRASA